MICESTFAIWDGNVGSMLRGRVGNSGHRGDGKYCTKVLQLLEVRSKGR